MTGSMRPPRYTPREWQKLPHEVRKSIAKAVEKENEAAKEKKKADDKVKESEAKSKAREEKKRATAEKKAMKKDGDEPKASVATDHGHVRRGQVIQYGKGRSFPTGKSTSNIWNSLTPTCQTMMTSLWSGTNGRRLRKGEDPWLIGITIMFMILNSVKLLYRPRRSTTKNVGSLSSHLRPIVTHSHVCHASINVMNIGRKSNRTHVVLTSQ